MVEASFFRNLKCIVKNNNLNISIYPSAIIALFFLKTEHRPHQMYGVHTWQFIFILISLNHLLESHKTKGQIEEDII